MNIIYFIGGLGNQMFQYALYKSLKIQGKAGVCANISWYKEEEADREFELTTVFPDIVLETDPHNQYMKKKDWYLKIRKNRKWAAFINYHVLSCCLYFKEREDGVYDERVFQLKNAAIKGYWQTEKYFYSIREHLCREFTFPFGEKKLSFLRKHILGDNSSVSVHIRRGDYLKNLNLYGNLSESRYYEKAIEYMAWELHSPHFIFFSDDIAWVKEHYYYSGSVYIEENMFENYQSWYDMCLMACCSHNIIANSSFSWWGAWLNHHADKIVIAPEQWFFDGRNGRDICPESWKRMVIS